MHRESLQAGSQKEKIEAKGLDDSQNRKASPLNKKELHQLFAHYKQTAFEKINCNLGVQNYRTKSK